MPEDTENTLGSAIDEAQRQQRQEERWTAHVRQHEAEAEAVKRALEVAERERKQHESFHDREHELHSEKHASEGRAIDTALTAVKHEREIHALAHEREHKAHEHVHELNDRAVGKAEASVEERLKAMNEFRGQLRDQQATFATRDALEVLRAEIDRRFGEQSHLTQERYETNRASITTLEKADVKGEGRSLGQGAVIAAIIGTVGLAATLLGMIIVIANFVTKAPA